MKSRQATTVLAVLLIAVGVAMLVTVRLQRPPRMGAELETVPSGWSTDSLPAGSRRRLRFLARTGYPPFCALEPGSAEPVGMDVDMAQALAKHLGVECSVIPVPESEIVSRFLRGEGDVLISSACPSPELDRYLDFTQSYYRSRGAMLVHKSDEARFREGLPEDARVGLLAGAAHGARLLSSTGRTAPVAQATDWESLLACMKQDRCDVMVTDVLTAYYFLSQHPDCGLALLPLPRASRHASSVCLAVREGSSELRKALDGALHDLQMDGTLRRVHHRYFPFGIE
jgi:ABC-type amino acid transport substrate-binding protein